MKSDSIVFLSKLGSYNHHVIINPNDIPTFKVPQQDNFVSDVVIFRLILQSWRSQPCLPLGNDFIVLQGDQTISGIIWQLLLNEFRKLAVSLYLG